MMKAKKHKGQVLVETFLVIIPFLAVTLGGFEYLWYIHIRQSLTAAATVVCEFVAANHRETDSPPSGGVSPNSLDPLRDAAQQKGENFLTNMGFTSSFTESLTITINYIQTFSGDNKRLQTGGFPQKDKLRLIGAQARVPWSKAMIFGDISASLLSLLTTAPEEMNVIVFNWKQWKENTEQN